MNDVERNLIARYFRACCWDGLCDLEAVSAEGLGDTISNNMQAWESLLYEGGVILQEIIKFKLEKFQWTMDPLR
jgi:hypothetical protein